MIPGVEFLRYNHRRLAWFNETIVFSCLLNLQRERSTLKQESPERFRCCSRNPYVKPAGIVCDNSLCTFQIKQPWKRSVLARGRNTLRYVTHPTFNRAWRSEAGGDHKDCLPLPSLTDDDNWQLVRWGSPYLPKQNLIAIICMLFQAEPWEQRRTTITPRTRVGFTTLREDYTLMSWARNSCIWDTSFGIHWPHFWKEVSAQTLEYLWFCFWLQHCLTWVIYHFILLSSLHLELPFCFTWH